ncbi:MAG: hypothetical protein JWM56_1153 [Candidatus Peribacteria bacterium]|nr:hypothetical protein [Candidatus Peribacteria bacterium]
MSDLLSLERSIPQRSKVSFALQIQNSKGVLKNIPIQNKDCQNIHITYA